MRRDSYEKIVFDDVTTESKGKWTQICDEHAYQIEQSKQFSKAEITDGGSGICGVKGCQNESNCYIDF